MKDRILSDEEVTTFSVRAGGPRPWIAVRLLCASHGLLQLRVKELEKALGRALEMAGN